MADLKLSVAGMSCGGCVNSVRTILSNQFAIDKDRIAVSLDDAEAMIDMDTAPSAEQLDAVLFELNAQGFPSQIAD